MRTGDSRRSAPAGAILSCGCPATPEVMILHAVFPALSVLCQRHGGFFAVRTVPEAGQLPLF